MIHVEHISAGDEHANQKWLVLEGSVAGCPQVTKRRSVSTAGLAAGTVSLQAEIAALMADVEEYHARWLAVQAALEKLNGT